MGSVTFTDLLRETEQTAIIDIEDIADVAVGTNVGAQLQAAQAEADLVRRFLPSKRFAEWLDRFMPELIEGFLLNSSG